jgi:hypothetical protein
MVDRGVGQELGLRGFWRGCFRFTSLSEAETASVAASDEQLSIFTKMPIRRGYLPAEIVTSS